MFSLKYFFRGKVSRWLVVFFLSGSLFACTSQQIPADERDYPEEEPYDEREDRRRDYPDEPF